MAEIDAAEADEPTLLRAAYNLRAGEVLPEDVAAEVVAASTDGAADTAQSSPTTDNDRRKPHLRQRPRPLC